MADKKLREEYDNSYEWRRDQLWKCVKEYNEEEYPNVISYFVKSGSVPITGKIFQPPTPLFEVEICIKKCFKAVQEKMVTKGGKLRANMSDLKEYEIQAWAALLDYLRFEWGVEENRGKVLLTKKEYGMLFMSSKRPKKK